jgi:hypothetical protein
MPIDPKAIHVGKCYLAELGDAVFLVLSIDPDGKVKYQIRTRVAGGGTAFSLQTKTRERFALSVVREVPCH